MKKVNVFSREMMEYSPLIKNGVLNKNEYKILWKFFLEFPRWMYFLGSIYRKFNVNKTDSKNSLRLLKSLAKINKAGLPINILLGELLTNENTNRAEIEKVLKTVNSLNKRYLKIKDEIDKIKS